MGEHDHFIAIGQMAVDKIIQQGPFQPRTQTAIDPEAGTGQASTPFVVNQAEARAEVNMMLRGEVEAMGLAVIAQRLVILLAARGKVRVRKVRQAQH